jgi:hypothetical protein
MRTVKWNPFLAGAMMLLGGALLWASAARADISSTNPAALVVFPKLVVDTSNGLDTVIQLTNTASDPVHVRCFYVDVNGHCSNDPSEICDPNEPASYYCSYPGYCVPGWTETDFALTLTPNQPIAWTVSSGLQALPLTAAQRPAPGGLFDAGSIPAAIEDPMIGELKCVEVGDDEFPVASNDLKGEATIEYIDTSDPQVDISGYNAIGIQANPDTFTSGSNTLILGEGYNACPNTLILDHFFDDAPVVNGYVETLLTLVPCSEDFVNQTCVTTVVQYLVYNEFEQRFSTSRSLTCFSELQLSDIDTRLGDDPPNNYASIFNVAVEGTLTGQTVIRGVADSDPSKTPGHGLLGVVEEFHQRNESPQTSYSAAYMMDMRGTRTQNDVIQLYSASPAQ